MDRLASLPWTPYYTQSGDASAVDAHKDSIFFYWSLALTLAFTVGVYAWEGYLDGRQWMSYQETEFPDALSKTVSAIDAESKEQDKLLLPQLREKFKKAQAYGLDKIQFGMVAALYDVNESCAFLLLGFLPYVWDLAVSVGNKYFGWEESTDEIKMSLIFLVFVTLIGTITSLPFELYSTFQIERKHGFNKMTLSLFVTDKIKGLLLSALFGGPFVALLLYIIKAGGPYFYLYAWGFMFVFSVLMMTLIPVVIMPMFNKYEPLPDGT
jgi:STE24 endopeptidase